MQSCGHHVNWCDWLNRAVNMHETQWQKSNLTKETCCRMRHVNKASGASTVSFVLR